MELRFCSICNKQLTLYNKLKTSYCHPCYLENQPKGKDSNLYKRGWFIRSGYKFIRIPKHPFANNLGYVREHRLVMEKIIGRYLQPYEMVHHRDSNRLNNSPNNLEIVTDQKVHMAKHPSRKKFCVVCNQPHMARGYCEKCYWKYFLKQHRANS